MNIPPTMEVPHKSPIPKLIALFIIICIFIGFIFLFRSQVSTDISRPPLDIACVSEDNPTWNYDQIHRLTPQFLENPAYYGYTRAGNGYSAYYQYFLGESYNALFDVIGPFFLDVSYWVEGTPDEPFYFNITIWEVESDWNGLDIAYENRPNRVGSTPIGQMELAGIGDRVEAPVFIALDISLEGKEYIAFEITSDIMNASVGLGFSDPDYFTYHEAYYDYYDSNYGIYYDEPHIHSANINVPSPSPWYYWSLVGGIILGIFIVAAILISDNKSMPSKTSYCDQIKALATQNPAYNEYYQQNCQGGKQ